MTDQTFDFETGPVASITVRPRWRSGRADLRTLRGAARLYCAPEGETWREHLAGGRHTRPCEEYRSLLPLIMRLAVGTDGQAVFPEGTRFRWSRHAGCRMCPCSPGFVSSARPAAPWGAFDVFVTIRAEAHALMQARRDSGVGRRAQAKYLNTLARSEKAAAEGAAR